MFYSKDYILVYYTLIFYDSEFKKGHVYLYNPKHYERIYAINSIPWKSI